MIIQRVLNDKFELLLELSWPTISQIRHPYDINFGNYWRNLQTSLSSWSWLSKKRNWNLLIQGFLNWWDLIETFIMINECNLFESSFKMNDWRFDYTDIIFLWNFLVLTWHNTEELTTFKCNFKVGFSQRENNLFEFIFTFQRYKFVSELCKVLIDQWLN